MMQAVRSFEIRTTSAVPSSKIVHRTNFAIAIIGFLASTLPGYFIAANTTSASQEEGRPPNLVREGFVLLTTGRCKISKNDDCYYNDFAVVRHLAIQKHKRAPICTRCRDKASFEVLHETEACYLMRRFCTRCLAGAGYDLPE
ncbi:hypothetical protein NTE_03504 [Candidatus Nitrososphaera evergladensis SR1]|uniref:Uncharacterized protein n=1 Tax=Candidatus Nitrososphaera evergladensis SR1 TaxID=1459636 RepID=A0A075MY08_9ARCH|nr:hypothetical protein NTE_03504 [Candidatus Nitrososphaera evergladensis SR1]